MARTRRSSKRRAFAGAVRACIDWKTVRTSRGREMRCAAYTEQSGCPDEAGHKKGYAECVGASGRRAGARARARKYGVVSPIRQRR